MTGSDEWAAVDASLQSSGQARIQAFCNHSERYAEFIDSWDLPTLLSSVWPNGQCEDAPEAELSGHTGVFCEYEYDGATWTSVIALVGPYFVQVQAETRGASDEVAADVRQMLDSVVLVIDGQDAAVDGDEPTSSVEADLSSDSALEELCGFGENIRSSGVWDLAATREYPQFWLERFPEVPVDGEVVCQQIATGTAADVYFVVLRDVGEAELRIAEEWAAGVAAAGWGRAPLDSFFYESLASGSGYPFQQFHNQSGVPEFARVGLQNGDLFFSVQSF